MNYTELTRQIEDHIKQSFTENISQKLPYHNFGHVEKVAKNVLLMAEYYRLNDKDKFIVTASAWFHDIGYLTGCNNHEEKGADEATVFLTKYGIEASINEVVTSCILATKLPQSPKNLLEQIVCDADLFHLGTDDFNEGNKLMRQEYELKSGKKIGKNKWRKKTVTFMQEHHFQTEYCQTNLNAKKAQNLADLKLKISEAEKEESPDLSKDINALNLNPILNQDKEKKDNRPSRGIETMFRISSNNHQRLSDMADNKAHIMISTTAIILSVVLSLLLRKLEDNPYLVFPTFLLLVICVITLVFSILATRPSIPSGVFTQEDIDKKKVNLLFFGNFYRMSLEDYTKGMLEMMDSREFLYGSLIRDLYFQGVVLGRKYRLLRQAYNVFMFGITTSVLAFIIASFTKM
ncbi:Pycsar system effector family protein [Solitalea lacus]|uniref:Pycsar system effector family protein n=1 Tax=Solitalea lacus TaxID=2911172 RepID=UPI001EDB8BFC|nr:Pycsar system effector family protein [Solitalea lacus]UKJ06051.1 DUF5706 domain-containing protein [Solitalea lacus]